MIAPLVRAATTQKDELFRTRVDRLAGADGEQVEISVTRVNAPAPHHPTIRVMLVDEHSIGTSVGLSPAAARTIAHILENAAAVDEHQREEHNLPIPLMVTPSKARELLGDEWRKKLAILSGASQ